MRIEVNQAGKRFGRQWIFRNAQYTFTANQKYAIVGSNGAGKSTFIKALAGALHLSEGSIDWEIGETKVPVDDLANRISWCSPYQQLIQEFTILEMVNFHFSFRALHAIRSTQEFLQAIGLEQHANKYLKDLSSGMQQRVKLGLAMFTESELILLDEPTTNLDEKGVNWYNRLIEDYSNKSMVLIASNIEREYGFVDEIVDVNQWKV